MSTPGQSKRHNFQNSHPSQGLCDAWRQGHCRFGNTCKFRHEPDEKGILKNTKKPALQEKNGNRKETAVASQTARFTDGSDQLNKLPQGTSSSAGPSKSTTGTTGQDTYTVSNFPVKSITCRDWKSGRCPRGERCRFGHHEQPAGTVQLSGQEHSKRQQRLLQQEAKKMKDEREEQEIVIRVAEMRAKAEKLAREQVERDKVEMEQVERESQEHTKQLEQAKGKRQAERKKAERELAQREAQEQARRIEQAEKKEAERRRREERMAQEKAAREARAELLRQEKERKAEEEKRRTAERLAREEAAREAFKKQQLELQARREQEAKVIEQYLVFDSSLVTCTAGLNISGIVTGFDLCSVVIKNLPRDAKQEEIADIFMHQGLERSDFFISQVKPNLNKLEAVVLVNSEFGHAITLGLEGIPFRNESLSFSLSDNAMGNAMGPSTRNSPFLLVSWRAPSDTIVAGYSTMEDAQEKARRLNTTSWHGRQIKAVMNERPQGVAGLRHFIPSSVKIMNLPPIGYIYPDLHTLTGTTNLKMLKSPHYNLDDSFNTIKSHFRGFSGVRMDTYEVLGSGAQESAEVKVKVLFEDWEDAKRAHVCIGNIQGGLNSPAFRSWVPPKPLRYTITIPQQQYEAQKRQWNELSEKKPGSDAYVETKIGNRGDVFIQVLGQDKKAIGSLKVRVESIVSGEKLDSGYWHQSLASNSARALFNRIYDEKKVFVRNDFKTRSLRVYGEPHMILEARTMIKAEIDRLAQRETTRMLDRSSIGFFVREGLGKLVELLGEDNVNLNLASRPCRITVKGGDEAIHHLQRLIEESRTTAFLGSVFPETAEKDICPICTDEASHPEKLVCGHTYCAGCLKHFLTSAVDAKNFPLGCMGNDGTCNVPIPIPFIQRFLPISVFQALVEAAFVSYLDQHPQELKYCTTPDCKQIYRHCARKAVLQCPSCFSTICPACDEEAHEDMTCEERRIHKNPALQERLNEELAQASGYKKCPQCNVWIEKTDGCNHMSCKCGAHICWRCMAISDHRGAFNGQTIYQHMETAHGNIYEEVPAAINIGHARNHAFVAVPVGGLARVERAPVAVQGALFEEEFRRVLCQPPTRTPEQQRQLETIQQRARIERQREAEIAQRARMLEEQRQRNNEILAAARAEEARRRREEQDRSWCIVM